MSMRKIKNAVNNTTGELIYFKGHAQATYMSDGSTVEDAIKNIKPDLSDYVKSEELEGYAKTSDIPSLEGYAKEEDIPSLDGYVQSSELPDFNEFIKSDDIPSLEGLATEDFVTSQGYLTEIPSEYITNTELNSKGYATKTELNSLDFDNINNTPFTNDNNGELNIVDEQGNVGLKLDGECLYVKDVVAGEHTLSNKADTSYVDEAIAQIVDGAPETLDTLNELSAALKDNADIVDVLNQSISSKQDIIPDLETIKQGAAKGATALQSYTEQYKGTVTGVKINGATKNPSNGVVDLGTVITSHQTLKTINGQSIVGSGDITISGGSSNANIQAVDTGDVLDDVNVEYATKAYVDTLVGDINSTLGDINSVLESIINGGSTPALIDNYMTYMSKMIEDTSSYYFLLEYPAESDLVIQATYSKPNVVNGTLQGFVDDTEEYHIDKGNMNINEVISEFREFTNVSITPEYDNVYRYIYNA